ncbi:hypothetical protein CHISP_0515 [Chitinispirillum alkaliphilum]|nr:hypothetical protein CHISP_0515 [Chitinispirillum alkaliphilum]
MFSNSKIKNRVTKIMIASAVVSFSLFVSNSFACGGGVIPFVPSSDPYVPSGTGDEIGSSLDGQFFLDLEKGVTNEMLDVKKFNPLFRHLTLTGNERRTRSRSTQKCDTPCDSTALPPCGVDHEMVEPILNLHRLH